MSEIKALEELRGIAKQMDDVAAMQSEHGFSPWALKARGIADKIEAEIAERFMRLPVDADGVPIRPGDIATVGGGEIHVAAVGFGGFCAAPLFCACDARHVQQDTVESVLEEYAQDKSEDWRIACDRYFREHCWSKDWQQDPEFSVVHRDNIAEYAERIRKAVE